MRALSVRQPWATLLVKGTKDVENRSWRVSYRGLLLICAGLRVEPGPEYDFLVASGVEMPTGMAVGRALPHRDRFGLGVGHSGPVPLVGRQRPQDQALSGQRQAGHFHRASPQRASAFEDVLALKGPECDANSQPGKSSSI
jgi:hypothetical protein